MSEGSQADKAESDANLFYSRYGCNMVIAKTFFQTWKAGSTGTDLSEAVLCIVQAHVS
jgi:hypothetical protein